MWTLQQTIEKVTCLCRKVETLRVQNRIASPSSDNWPIPNNVGVVVISTSGANTRDMLLRNPILWKNRRITVVNESGAAQNVLSYDGGTALTIKSTNGAAVGTLAMANVAAATTATAR